MKTPRKLYLLVSRKSRGAIRLDLDVFKTHKAAELRAAKRNKYKSGGGDDWRVETFVKGD